MCNEAARRTALGLMREDFSQLKIPLRFPEGLPNLGEAPSIRITDSSVIVRPAPGAASATPGAASITPGADAAEAEMVQRRWSWVGPPQNGAGAGGRPGKPVYNYRSEGRRFGNSAGGGRCLIPLDGFYEFTDAPGEKLKSKWLFTLADPGERPAPGLFCVAGLWRADMDLGKAGRGEAWTMLTCAPGPDVAPYHSRQIVVMPRDRWADWLGGVVPAADLIAPTPAGTLVATRVR